MASLLFEDFEFPVELYNRADGEFTTPVKTLLDFAPQILTELSKPQAEQQPIRAGTGWFSRFTTRSKNGDDPTPTADQKQNQPSSNSTSSNGVASVVLREGFRAAVSLAQSYIETQGANKSKSRWAADEDDDYYDRRERERRRRRQREREEEEEERIRENRRRQSREEDDDEEEAEESEGKHKDKKSEGNDGKAKKGSEDAVTKGSASDASNFTALQAVGVVSAVSVSAYSAYKASATYGEVTFREQLRQLLENVEEILQSAKAWMKEQTYLDRTIPTVVKQDAARLEKLVATLHRLDNTSERRKAAVAWGMSGAGALGTAVGVGVGSVMAATGGLALVGAGVAFGIVNMARHSTKEWKASRALVEGEARTHIEALKRRDPEQVCDAFGLDEEGRVKREAAAGATAYDVPEAAIPSSARRGERRAESMSSKPAATRSVHAEPGSKRKTAVPQPAL